MAAVPVALLLLSLWLAALTACSSTNVDRATRLQLLDSELATRESATAVLEQWCGTYHLAADPRIHADRITGNDQPADATVRRELGVGPDEPVRYRHVRLRCGAVVLSEAENWYVPARLTPQMNALLDSSDEPFGRVVRPLAFRRLRRDTEVLWPPQASRQPGAKAPHDPAPRDTARTVLRHRAVLVLPDGTPFCYLIESYRREALAGH
jgi:chorismate-pyruvate lyase